MIDRLAGFVVFVFRRHFSFQTYRLVVDGKDIAEETGSIESCPLLHIP